MDVFSEGYARPPQGSRVSAISRSRRSRNVSTCPWRERTTLEGFRWGVAKLVKAPDFDSGIRGFESFLPFFFTSTPPAAHLLAPCPPDAYSRARRISTTTFPVERWPSIAC